MPFVARRLDWKIEGVLQQHGNGHDHAQGIGFARAAEAVAGAVNGLVGSETGGCGEVARRGDGAGAVEEAREPIADDVGIDIHGDNDVKATGGDE